MPRTRNPYPPEFREQIVALAQWRDEDPVVMGAVIDELGPDAASLIAVRLDRMRANLRSQDSRGYSQWRAEGNYG